MFRPEDAEGLEAVNLLGVFTAKLADDDVRAACEAVEREIMALAELLGVDTSEASLALVAGCALQRKELEACQL
jgi:hypothetical protein